MRHCSRFPTARWLLAAASLALLPQLSQAATKILFVGNSFTHGNFDPTQHYNAANVHDLNGLGWGGVPGIFKKLADESGLSYDVSMEAVSAQSLQYHYSSKLGEIGSTKFDVVALQDYSTLDINNPGNPTELHTYSKLLEQYIHVVGNNPNANPNAKVFLTATWPRADQVYNTPGGHWNGTSIERMGADIHEGYFGAALLDTAIAGVNPVGDAFLLAVHTGVADRDPYDGIDAGKIDLWNVDYYHASAWGSYLEALTLFGNMTGLDPRSFGGGDQAASGLGISSAQAIALQNVAAQVLNFANPATESLVSAQSLRCLDSPSADDGRAPLLWDCTNGVNQQWVHLPDSTLRAHGKCLALLGAPAASGAAGLMPCTASLAQQWHFNDDGSISSLSSGLCLDVTGAATADNTPVATWTCNGNANQKWAHRPTVATVVGLEGVGATRCLNSAAATDGTRPLIEDCTGSVGQQWSLLPDGTITDQGKCLEVVGNNVSGAAVDIATCNGAADQKWLVKANGSIANAQSAFCLDVTGGATANNSAVEVWTCTGGSNQKWVRTP